MGFGVDRRIFAYLRIKRGRSEWVCKNGVGFFEGHGLEGRINEDYGTDDGRKTQVTVDSLGESKETFRFLSYVDGLQERLLASPATLPHPPLTSSPSSVSSILFFLSYPPTSSPTQIGVLEFGVSLTSTSGKKKSRRSMQFASLICPCIVALHNRSPLWLVLHDGIFGVRLRLSS